MSMVVRYVLFVVAVIVQASGIALVVKSMLGTSPISSLPYVISLASPFTLGQMTFTINMVLVLGQYLLLRKGFDTIQFLQVPVTLIFSWFIDFFMDAWAWVVPANYVMQLLPLLAGTTLIAFGVAVQGIANVLMLPGEGIVYAVSRHFHLEFGKVKTGNDISLVMLAAVISLIYLDGIEGIREGTLISALITGTIARFFLKHLGKVDANGNLVFHPHW
ncbi:YczE/YyaS/YitT family protein [Selenomonas ruminis]|uniref:YitT family protein n=1 Tax=Selenomonas ruminis TaxID=2593411 RepID=A0A5D6W3Q9_9FIRM|nr:DUF6198 family protein [Selenomonas sp. mPRGC5]TYZ22943.1 hypothetical protein FZ040_06915 [Selenomonas sp. mPRGC5]